MRLLAGMELTARQGIGGVNGEDENKLRRGTKKYFRFSRVLLCNFCALALSYFVHGCDRHTSR